MCYFAINHHRAPSLTCSRHRTGLEEGEIWFRERNNVSNLEGNSDAILNPSTENTYSNRARQSASTSERFLSLSKNTGANEHLFCLFQHKIYLSGTGTWGLSDEANPCLCKCPRFSSRSLRIPQRCLARQLVASIIQLFWSKTTVTMVTKILNW